MTISRLPAERVAGQPSGERPRLRIAYIAPIVWSPWKAHFARAFELLSDDLEGFVFTSSNDDLTNVRIGRFGLWAVENSGSALSKIRRLWCQTILPIRLSRRLPIQAVVAYDPYASGFAAVLLSQMLRVPCVIEMNGDYHEAEPGHSEVKRLTMRATLNWVMRRATAIRVLNASQETFVRKNFPHAKLFKFADFAALSVFEGQQCVQGDYLLSVGYPFHLKGMDLLIRAFKNVVRDFPHISLRIMGYAPPEELAQFQAMAAGVRGISFIPAGWLDEVAAQMRGAFALVNAARTEAMGRVHLEAMACGKPVVASRTNGACELIVDGETGVLFDIGDEEALRLALVQLLERSDRAHAMGEAGRRRVRELYSESAYRQHFTHMVRSVVSG